MCQQRPLRRRARARVSGRSWAQLEQGSSLWLRADFDREPSLPALSGLGYRDVLTIQISEQSTDCDGRGLLPPAQHGL
jgi:hypothetical protein